MSAAVDEEIQSKLSDVFHIRTGAVSNGSQAHRVELLANLLYLYDESWSLEGDGVKVVVGNHQEQEVKTGNESVKPQVLKKVKKWLMLAELGHLVTGDSSIVEGKKFRRLITGMMDRLEHKLGVDGVKVRVRQVASIQARLGGKENFKSPAKLGNKRLVALQQSPLVVQNSQLNSSTLSIGGTNSPEKAKIPTGKQLPRTPPSLNATATDNSCLGESLVNDSGSPSSRRMNSFYSPNVSKVQSKIRRDKSRAQLQVSASEFDMSVRSIEQDPGKVVSDKNSSSGPMNTSTSSLAPPPGKQLAHSPPVPAPASIVRSAVPASSPPAPPSRAAAPPSPPVPAVAKLVAALSSPDLPVPDLSTYRCITPDLSLPPTPQVVQRSDSPELPLPPPPSELSDSSYLPLPVPPPAAARPVTPPVSTLLAKHHIPTGRQLPSTPQLHTAKMAPPVEPSGKYELTVELETVAIPTQVEVDRLERKRAEEERIKQEEKAKEVELKMAKIVKAKVIEKKRLEDVEHERKKFEENKRQEEERRKLDDDKKMIEEMKRQLMEKAKLLEEKERNFKIEENRRKDEETKRQKESLQSKESIEDVQKEMQCENGREEGRGASQRDNAHVKKKMHADQVTEDFDKPGVPSGEILINKNNLLKIQSGSSNEGKLKLDEQKKVIILAKEKKLRDEAEAKRKEEIRKSETMKIKLKEAEVEGSNVKNVSDLSDNQSSTEVSRQEKEADKREKLKKEMMEAKLAKRKLSVEERIQKVEATRKTAQARREEYANGKMVKQLRQSINSADINLTSTGEALESSVGCHASSSEVTSVEAPDAVNSSRSKELEPVVEVEATPKVKKKTIRIGRRPAKKALSVIPSLNLKDNYVQPSEEPESEVVAESIEKSHELDTNLSKPKTISHCTKNRSENIGTQLTKADQNQEDLVSQNIDEICSESVLYPVVSTRRRSQCSKPDSEEPRPKARGGKRRSVATILQEESPPKKGKIVVPMQSISEKPKRGRKKRVDALQEVGPLAGEYVDKEEVEIDLQDKKTKEKVTSMKIVKNGTNIKPPVVHEESSLLDKLERRRKRIDETILNPETAISASKIGKNVSTPGVKTSLEKKLLKQRKVVDEAAEAESQNPTPVKSLVRQSRRKQAAPENKVSPPKKMKEVLGKRHLIKKNAAPEVEDESSLMAKLDKRKKKIEESSKGEEFTFTNKINKKISATQITESLEKKLVKQRNKAESLDEVDSVKDNGNVKSSNTVQTAPSSGKLSIAANSKSLSSAKKVSKKGRRLSSEEQEYYTAAEESIMLTRPRRNCKKKFENLEGLGSSSVSNTPTLGLVDADDLKSRKFQFPNSEGADHGSKDAESFSDDKPVKKRPGRKPGKSVKATELLSSGDKPATNISAVEVVVHPPKENEATPKLVKNSRKPKLHQKVPEVFETSNHPDKTQPVPRNSRRTKAQLRCALSSMDDEVYQTPTTKIPDDIYQTPRPMGSFSEVHDEQYETPEETVRKPKRKLNTRKK